MAYSSKNDLDNEIRIVLIGRTKVGKSTTGNRLIGYREFETKVSASSVTKQTQCATAERFGKKLIVFDTPGLFHTDLSKEEILKDICRALQSVPKIHAILLVVQAERLTEEDEITFECLMEAFGVNLKDFLIVVFTHKNRIEQQNMSVDDFVETIAISSNLRKLINDSERRYAAIGYGGRKEDREMEIQQILSMVNEIRQKGNTYCSDDLSEGVQKIIEESRSINKGNEGKNKDVKKSPINLLQGNFILNALLTVGSWIAIICSMLTRGIRRLRSFIEYLFEF